MRQESPGSASTKNIVLLSDGTGNSSAKLFRTNIWRIYEALDLVEPVETADGVVPPRQVVLYDNGVGTSGFRPLALLGGVFGFGLKRNVCDLYAFLCRHYVPGDRIYCFGFSRGAFTIRMLMALVALEGVLPVGYRDGQIRPEDADRYALLAYRRLKRVFTMDFDIFVRLGRGLRDAVQRWRDRLAGRPDYDSLPGRHWPNVEFVGLFDTVAAYGLPVDELTRAWGKVFWPLQPDDWDLSRKVSRACHALSLDDPRRTFHPKLWNEHDELDDADNIREERISQVWFPGVHSNVGGGYADDGLAFGPLVWILEEAERLRLRLKPGRLDQWRRAISIAAPMPDPRRGLGGTYRYAPRKLAHLTRDADNDIFVRRPKIHHSVFDRIATAPGYAPFGLPAAYAVVDNAGNILSGDDNPYEAAADAARRVRFDQERVWDTVWWRRIVYLLSVLVGLAIVLMPAYVTTVETQPCLGRLCDSAVLLDALAQVTPGFMEVWYDAFRARYDRFVLLLAAGGVLIWLGRRAEARINWGLAKYWLTALEDPGAEAARPPPRRSAIYWFRTRPAYREAVALLTKQVLPWGFVLLIALLAVWFVVTAVTHTTLLAGALDRQVAVSAGPPAGKGGDRIFARCETEHVHIEPVPPTHRGDLTSAGGQTGQSRRE